MVSCALLTWRPSTNCVLVGPEVNLVPDNFFRNISSTSSGENSWARRVRENLQQLFVQVRVPTLSANGAALHFIPSGAPIHSISASDAAHPRRSQTASLLTHAVVIAAIALLAARSGHSVRPTAAEVAHAARSLVFHREMVGIDPSDVGGKGGHNNPVPATSGNLPPRSSILLLNPSLPQPRKVELPVPPTILDPNAAPVLTPVENVGLPWMADKTDSEGPGKNHGIGSADGNNLGDSGNGPAGDGEVPGNYRGGRSMPVCNFCPEPNYSDEARQAKLQGSVMLQVLVGANGKAADVRVTRGMGSGLDEQAIRGVRAWRFYPARDGRRQAVDAWITVEVVFRLY